MNWYVLGSSSDGLLSVRIVDDFFQLYETVNSFSTVLTLITADVFRRPSILA